MMTVMTMMMIMNQRSLKHKCMKQFAKACDHNIDTKNARTCSVGDVVRLRIPGVDRTRLDRKFLPGKVLEIVRDNLYCTLGTLDVCYQAELELTLADFHELEDIPDTTVSLTKWRDVWR